MHVGLGRRGMRAGEEEGLGPDLGLDRVRCDDGRAQQVACRRLARGGVDEVMKLSAVALPARGDRVPMSRGRRPRARASAWRSGRRLSMRFPQGDVAARVDEARAGRGQDRRGLLGGVAFADAAEVEPDAAIELDAIPVDPDSPPQGRRPPARGRPREARRTCGRSPPEPRRRGRWGRIDLRSLIALRARGGRLRAGRGPPGGSPSR